MKLRILSIIIPVLCLLSCTEPNVYTSLGLYDPARYSEGTIKTVSVAKGEEFNLLSLTDDYKGKIVIRYVPGNSYNIIKQLSDKEADTLIQTIDYLSRYGDLDSYLSRPLDPLSKTYCKDTRAFAVEILDDITSFIKILSENLEAAGISINPDSMTKFFEMLENEVHNARTDTVKDYITIQLTSDTIASVFDALYILLVDTTGDLIVNFECLINNGDNKLMAGVASNAVELTSVLLDALSQIDLVGKDIGSFFSLSDIVEDIL